MQLHKAATMKNIGIGLTLMIALVACKKKPDQPLEQTTLDKVCTDAYKPFYDERKYVRYHRVEFTGYLQTPRSAMISSSMFVDVYEKPNRQGKMVRASFNVGSGKNKVERLKSGYSENSLKIKGDNGSSLGNGSFVKIQANVTPGGIPGKPVPEVCHVGVETVERAQ
jgi:hypothetical protein